jgi:hypothetical protein
LVPAVQRDSKQVEVFSALTMASPA